MRLDKHAGLYRVGKSGGEPEAFVLSPVEDFAVSQGLVVWINNVDVVLARKESGGARTWISYGGWQSGWIVRCGQKVVWVQGHRLKTAPITGGNVSLLAEERGGVLGVSGLAADATSAYWIGADSAVRGKAL